MRRFSEEFGLGLSQPALDFVDIPLDADLAVYVDPFAISIYDDVLSRECNDSIMAFFQSALTAIRNGDEAHAALMLASLSEPNETRLGVSRGLPQGRGVSGKQARDLYKSISESKAAKSGLVTELSECDLFINGIARDKVSDITTNIIRGHLIEYTQQQCELHNIEMASKVPGGPVWDYTHKVWNEGYVYLPTYRGTRVMLVPKNLVRRKLALDSQDYLNKHVLEYLQAAHLRAGDALVSAFKNGNRKVHKTTLRDHYPCTKDWLAEFSKQHPTVLERYKEVMRRVAKVGREAEARALNGEIEEKFFAQALIEELMDIPPGNDDATRFHNLTKGIIEFLFWPGLINPVKECEINEGRKRIDIMYDNAAQEGFFYRIRTGSQTSALKVPVECKNYSKDPANPEIDQLGGRFAPNRGKLGLLLYRTTSNYRLLVERCRDSAVEQRGFILPLGDTEIIEMLNDVVSGKRDGIDRRLSILLDRIIS